MKKLWLVAATVALALSVSAAASSADSPEHLPTISRDHRGTNVEAAQHLLRAHGFYSTTPNGIYNTTMTNAVVAFKQANGLGSSDKVDSTTWDALAIPITSLHLGAPNDEMRAAALLLNEKRGESLPLSGMWFIGETVAMSRFQDHRGIPADGFVDQEDWRHLISHKEPLTFDSRLCAAGPTGPGEGKGFTDPWGTSESVAHVEYTSGVFELLQTWYGKSFGDIAVTDFSIDHGNTPGHTSHNYGMDVDLRPIRLDNAQCSLKVTYEWPAYDLEGTLFEALSIVIGADFGAYLMPGGNYFNDPVVQFFYPEFTYYEDHDNHFHVKYCTESPSPAGLRTC